MAARLYDKAEKMRALSITEVKEIEDETTGQKMLVIPANWSQRDIVAFAKAGAELARLATEMAGSHIDVRSDGKPLISSDLLHEAMKELADWEDQHGGED